MGEFKGTRNINGRPKGSSNKNTAELKAVISQIIDKNLETIEADFKELDAKERIRLTIDLMAYVMPKLKAVELTNEGNNTFKPITVNIMQKEDINKIIEDLEAKY